MRWLSRLVLGVAVAVLSVSSGAARHHDKPLLLRHVERVLSAQASDQAACDAAFAKNPFASYLKALPATGGLRNCIGSNVNDLMVTLSAPGAKCTLTSLVGLLGSGNNTGMAALTEFFNALVSGLSSDSANTTAATQSASPSSVLASWTTDTTKNEAFCSVMNTQIGPCADALVPVIISLLEKKAACCEQLSELYDLAKLLIPDGKTLDQTLVGIVNGLHGAMCTTLDGATPSYCGQSVLAMLAAVVESTDVQSLLSPLLFGGALPLFALPDGAAACAAVEAPSFASRVSSSGGNFTYPSLSCCAVPYASLIQSFDGVLKHLTGNTLSETFNLIAALQDAPSAKQFTAPYAALAKCTFTSSVCSNPSFMLTEKPGSLKTSSTNSSKNMRPQDLQCTTTELCDADKVCSTVCKQGSAKVAPWVARAVSYQRNLSYAKPLCVTQLPGTHNSGTTLARGWGNRDQLMNKVLDPTNTASYMRTNNQFLTLTDQLQLGVRFVELDVHYFSGQLHDGHCSRISFAVLDDMSKVIKMTTEALLSAGQGESVKLEWQSSLMGCLPSLGGQRAEAARAHADTVQEIAAWLKANSNEFLIVYLDVGSEVKTFKKFGDAIALHTKAYGNLLLTPEDVGTIGAWKTTPLTDFIKQGKRVALVTGNGKNDGEGEAFFTLDSLCGGWTDVPSGKTGGAAGTIWGATTNAGKLVRAYSSQLHYATMSEEALAGGALVGTATEPATLSAATLPVFMNAGVNILAPDGLDGAVLQAMVWSWAPNEPSRGDKAVEISAMDGRWYGVPDKASIKNTACVSTTSRVAWKIVAQGSSCPEGYAFGAPTLAIENAALVTALKATGAEATAQLNVDVASLPVISAADEAAYSGGPASGATSGDGKDGSTGKDTAPTPQPSSGGRKLFSQTMAVALVVVAVVSLL